MQSVSRGVSFLGACALVTGLAGLAVAGEVQGRIDISSLEKLRAGASEVSEVNLDAPAIKRVVENPDLQPSIREVAKGLTEVHALMFEMGDGGTVSLTDLDEIRAQLKDPSWTKVLSNQEKQELQELYTLKSGEQIAGIVVLVAEAQELTVVNLVGSIDPAKLADLNLEGLGELGEAMVESQVGGGKEAKEPKKAGGQASKRAKVIAPTTVPVFKK
jgi:hypothetical protein